ncbi:MAG: hypothetical protein LBV22_00755 [Mycoplasmataceae bacterium]|nr:hypothetical protein [Mycoplasmataceae bacterium]
MFKDPLLNRFFKATIIYLTCMIVICLIISVILHAPTIFYSAILFLPFPVIYVYLNWWMSNLIIKHARARKPDFKQWLFWFGISFYRLIIVIPLLFTLIFPVAFELFTTITITIAFMLMRAVVASTYHKES